VTLLAMVAEQYNPSLASKYRQSIIRSITLCDVASGSNPDIVKALLTEGVNANSRCPPYEDAPLQRADDLTVAQLLIAYGANVNVKDESDRTPLHEALSRGDSDMVKLLLAHGAKLNVKDQTGRTPLHEAASGGNVDLVRLLVAHGAETSIEDTYGVTPIDVASDPQFIELLKENANKK
jgi:ankyrin repeat protein